MRPNPRWATRPTSSSTTLTSSGALRPLVPRTATLQSAKTREPAFDADSNQESPLRLPIESGLRADADGSLRRTAEIMEEWKADEVGGWASTHCA